MAVITKDQLKFTYQWNAIPPDDPRVTGKPDSTFLSRNEGYEVLPFLNRHCQDLGAALKAERMIKRHLPGDVRSQKNVLIWLQANWAAY